MSGKRAKQRRMNQAREKELAKKVEEIADVVIDGNAPGAMEQLGRAINRPKGEGRLIVLDL